MKLLFMHHGVIVHRNAVVHVELYTDIYMNDAIKNGTYNSLHIH